MVEYDEIYVSATYCFGAKCPFSILMDRKWIMIKPKVSGGNLPLMFYVMKISIFKFLLIIFKKNQNCAIRCSWWIPNGKVCDFKNDFCEVSFRSSVNTQIFAEGNSSLNLKMNLWKCMIWSVLITLARYIMLNEEMWYMSSYWSNF